MADIMRLIVFILFSSIGLNGCLHIAPPYRPSGAHWSKKGISDGEVHKFHWKCYARRREMRDAADLNLIFQLEIEAQNCMLEDGFSFKDATRSEKKCALGNMLRRLNRRLT